MQVVTVDLGPRRYDIAIGGNTQTDLGAFIGSRLPGRSAFVVSDANTGFHAETVAESLVRLGFRVIRTEVPAGEESKSIAIVNQLWERLAAMAASRRTVIVAVGGGVIGDLAGFVAATYARGIPLVMVPTTLLAMVDSSVGGKTGINLKAGKNLVGAFHQPAAVWVDTQTLATLPVREFVSGLAEVVKYGMILDSEFFAWLETHTSEVLARNQAAIEFVIARSCRMKADVVEKDEREETGLRVTLNYGHTFAHAFETIGGYGNWLHGEAVAAGMVCASRLAQRLGLIDDAVTVRQIRLLQSLGLPVSTRSEWSIDAMIEVMRRDKKSLDGRLRFVLPTTIGHVRLVEGIDEEWVVQTLREASALASEAS
jgi:3-dehydroquinate synthase